jgi:hypothetical protein
MNTTTQRIEVFRHNCPPQIAKCYEIADWTEQTGAPEEENVRYFTTQPRRYMGQFIERCTIYDDDRWWWICTFKDNDQTNCIVDARFNNKVSWREVADTKPNRQKVFRLSPEKGKYYEYAEYTERVGVWPENHYFTTNPLRYVGKHIQHYQEGGGDGADHWDILEDAAGNTVRIDYTYEGTTCFREVSPPNILI